MTVGVLEKADRKSYVVEAETSLAVSDPLPPLRSRKIVHTPLIWTNTQMPGSCGGLMHPTAHEHLARGADDIDRYRALCARIRLTLKLVIGRLREVTLIRITRTPASGAADDIAELIDAVDLVYLGNRIRRRFGRSTRPNSTPLFGAATRLGSAARTIRLRRRPKKTHGDQRRDKCAHRYYPVPQRSRAGLRTHRNNSRRRRGDC